jgi:hypothetical protein
MSQPWAVNLSICYYMLTENSCQLLRQLLSIYIGSYVKQTQFLLNFVTCVNDRCISMGKLPESDSYLLEVCTWVFGLSYKIAEFELWTWCFLNVWHGLAGNWILNQPLIRGFCQCYNYHQIHTVVVHTVWGLPSLLWLCNRVCFVDILCCIRFQHLLHNVWNIRI